jgi:inorganic pyrophosphatase
MLKEFVHFFETYKVLKGKGDIVEVRGYKGKKEAKEAIEKAIEIYKSKYPEK